MTEQDWQKSSYFKATENFGEPLKMEKELIEELNKFREKINTTIYISMGTQGKHCEGSAHYDGKAVDILFPRKKLSDVPDLFLEALRFNFFGLGLYANWMFNGEVKGGLHLDIRDAKERAMWIGVGREYLPVSWTTGFHLFNVARLP